MKKIRIAQIGTGHDHAGNAFDVLKNRTDLFDLVAVAPVPEDDFQIDRFHFNLERGFEGIPERTFEEVLNDPTLDAVCIETEDRALTKYALMAAKKGLHIQMDKPGGVDDAEFDRLIDLVQEKKLVFHTGYMYRYNPAIRKLKEEIQAGKLGEIYSVDAQMNCIHEADKRNWLSAYPGGMLYFLGCHMIDLIYGICGEPEEVIPLSTSSGADGVESEDFGMAILRYPNGVSMAKSTAVEIGGFDRRQVVVCGSKGTVEIRPLEWHKDSEELYVPQISKVREVHARDWNMENEFRETETFGRYNAMFEAFASYVRGDAKNPYDYEYERNLHKLILKACGAK